MKTIKFLSLIFGLLCLSTALKAMNEPYQYYPEGYKEQRERLHKHLETKEPAKQLPIEDEGEANYPVPYSHGSKEEEPSRISTKSYAGTYDRPDLFGY